TFACTSAVTSPEGITTSDAATIDVDTLAPSVALAATNPAGICGTTVGPEADIEGTLADGVQIPLRAIAGGATSLVIEQLTEAGPPPAVHTPAATGFATITLVDGDNTFVARATDPPGPDGTSAPCEIRLEDLAIAFVDPIASGLVGPGDGSVAGDRLTLDVCGTVGPPTTAAVQLSIDGGAPVMATVDAGTGTWCVEDVTLDESPPVHTLIATGSAGTSSGTAVANVTVDLTGPDAPTGVAATVVRRESVA